MFTDLGAIRRALAAPRINDITTDLDDPPCFSPAGEAAKATSKPTGWIHPERIVAAHRAGYPDLHSHRLNTTLDDAHQRVVHAMAELGWSLTHVDAEAGTLEATDTTRWCRFTDDVVLRLRAEGDRVVLDGRSRSRLGRADFGANAARLRALFERL